SQNVPSEDLAFIGQLMIDTHDVVVQRGPVDGVFLPVSGIIEGVVGGAVRIWIVLYDFNGHRVQTIGWDDVVWKRCSADRIGERPAAGVGIVNGDRCGAPAGISRKRG